MYLHTKYGFVEVDAWDGQPLPLKTHQREVDGLLLRSPVVVVVRSRQRRTIAALLDFAPSDTDRKIFKSPPGWDYEYRVYLTPDEWAMVMARIALDLDYRNFKSWTTKNSPKQHALAHAIWHAAHDHKEI